MLEDPAHHHGRKRVAEINVSVLVEIPEFGSIAVKHLAVGGAHFAEVVARDWDQPLGQLQPVGAPEVPRQRDHCAALAAPHIDDAVGARDIQRFENAVQLRAAGI